MLKLRLHGEKESIEEYINLLEALEEEKILTILSKSDYYADRGQSKYYRVYIDITRNRNI